MGKMRDRRELGLLIGDIAQLCCEIRENTNVKDCKADVDAFLLDHPLVALTVKDIENFNE